ncbi:vacuolar protein sorting-associated protein 41 homolog isoform X2 [Uloborus diversus]|uniref:vacuolar protein sorting-associated protein 41 homolog isoform X2 n=1 Tax=Uloborus diversus TaxID=327109 RepID=UPI0024091CAC|nr:vacuolar protein sorting-associated protein 41 homolog isoform X2 [Uloborus diversus]
MIILEVEPKLCYERLTNDVPNILRKDAASCISVHPKFLALGTHLGVIHILDHQGNNIRNKELLLHVTTVNQISIDEKGDYIASCSNDGKVAIHGLYSSDFSTSVTIERPVRSVAIDPNFSKSSGNRRFIIGEDKVVLYERHILTGYKPNVLYQGEGAIRNLKWKERFIVWASDKTVRVYDINSGRTITVIQRDHDPLLRSDLYRCNLHWKDDKTLLIGWANTVKVCQVVPSEGPRASLTTLKDQGGPPRFYVKITSIFNTDFYICGISSLGAAIVVLTVKKTEEPVSIGSRPQLRVLESHGESYTSILSDTLVLRGYQEYRCNDYHLESLSEEGLYFILSLKDFVVAKPRNDDDHIAWLLEHDRFKEALKAVSESKNLRKYTLLDVGNIYLNHLFELRQYSDAAELCGTIFEKNKDVWETGVYRFAELGQLRVIAPFIPTDDLVLVPAIYEMILNEFLQYDQKGFLNLVRSWPSHVYDVPTIITVVLEQLALFPDSKLLLESLSELYIYDKKFDKAFNVLIEIGSKDRIFKLIQNHNLFGSVHDKLDTLMELNPSAATSLLLNNVEKVPVNLVVSKLKNKKQLLYEYLHKAFLKDPTLGEEHHGLLVELYAEYAPELLLPFLRTSHNYSLEFALDICQQRSLIHEVVFLLGRMGNTKQALEQITEQLQDINQAIQFCKEHDDKELWEDLIESSLDKPSFITVLLQNIGTHVDPIMLIQKIPNGMEIPGLRDSLVKILHDYTLQVSLREGCKKILVADCYSLLEKLNKLQKRGILVSENQVCPLCERKLFTNDSRTGGDVIIFHCKHVFHEDCVPVMHLQKWETCTICSAQKRGTPGSS